MPRYAVKQPCFHNGVKYKPNSRRSVINSAKEIKPVPEHLELIDEVSDIKADPDLSHKVPGSDTQEPASVVDPTVNPDGSDADFSAPPKMEKSDAATVDVATQQHLAAKVEVL